MLAVFNGSLTEKIAIFDVPMMNDLKIARHIDFITGAGISPESSIPTFRDAKSGLWERYDPATLASPAGYTADKALDWGWHEWRRMGFLKAKPNLGQYTIVTWQIGLKR
jgi:NAD-dependent deacetylase